MKDKYSWDLGKEALNIQKHRVDFKQAVRALQDPYRVIILDEKHSVSETRFFCLGNLQGRVLTVRFIYRDNKIRILGAGFWRRGVKIYEKENRRRHANWQNNRNS